MRLAKQGLLASATVIFLVAHSEAQAQDVPLVNAGFETGFKGWSVEGRETAVALSKDADKGEFSAKIQHSDGLIQQALVLPRDGHYTVSVEAKGSSLIGIKQGDRLYFNRGKGRKKYEAVSVTFPAVLSDEAVFFLGFSGQTVSYDDVTITYTPNAKLSPSIERKSATGDNQYDKRLIANVPPAQNFDLLGWNLSVPTDEDGNGRSDTISETRLAAGYEDPRFFFTSPEGGMTFRAPIVGSRTSNNTKFTRVELREMLRRGDTSIKTRRPDGRPNGNNWAFSSAPQKAQNEAGGIDGRMEATLQVDYVPLTGKPHEIGRVIIGQIHARDDEPIRLYYRKLPHNERGSIYFAHEIKGQDDDLYIDLLGSRRNDVPDPEEGIRLGERFSYTIDVVGNTMSVGLSQYGRTLVSHTLDMSGSGYDAPDDFHYFKAGAYNQNNSGDTGEYSQVTFYALDVSHG